MRRRFSERMNVCVLGRNSVFVVLSFFLLLTGCGDSSKREDALVAVKSRSIGDRFVTYTNGTVVDTKTGLMWAAEDSYHEDKSGSRFGENWYEAKAYCEKYRGGGYDDWRMPTLAELKELYAAFSGKSVEELEREFWSKGKSVNISVTYSSRTRNVPIWIYGWIWSSDQRSSEAA